MNKGLKRNMIFSGQISSSVLQNLAPSALNYNSMHVFVVKLKCMIYGHVLFITFLVIRPAVRLKLSRWLPFSLGTVRKVESVSKTLLGRTSLSDFRNTCYKNTEQRSKNVYIQGIKLKQRRKTTYNSIQSFGFYLNSNHIRIRI